MKRAVRACRGTRRGRPRADRAATPAAPEVRGHSCRAACRCAPPPARPGPPREPGSTPYGRNDPAQRGQVDIRADPDAGAVRQRDLNLARRRRSGRRRQNATARRRGAYGCRCVREHLHRQEPGRSIRSQGPATDLLPPVPQQPAADLIPTGNMSKARARRFRLRHDPQLILGPPPASPLNPSDDLHPATRPNPWRRTYKRR